MNTSLKFMTLIQRLGKPETIINADDELTRRVNMGYRVVSEIVLGGDESLTRVIRLEIEQPMAVPEPESEIGKMVREHGSGGADRILQQNALDRARESHDARRAHYRNNLIPLPVFPIREDK